MKVQRSFQKGDDHRGDLYLVPTPIGNLEDMTFRGVRILSEVSLILSEDTRHTIHLLNHYEINNRLESFHDHSSKAEADHYIRHLLDGKDIALVSDAGMPLINDPGHPLVVEALEVGIHVISLPGANAALTALISSGLPIHQFAYYGFFPKNKQKKKEILQKINVMNGVAIFYESPYRIRQAVEAVYKFLSPETSIVIARELTKRYEEYIRGSASQVMDYLKQNSIKGECVLMIQTQAQELHSLEEFSDQGIQHKVQQLIKDENIKPNKAIAQVAKHLDRSRKEIYNIYHQLRETD